MGINSTNGGIQHISGDRRRALAVTSNTTLPVVRGRGVYPGQAPGYEASLLVCEVSPLGDVGCFGGAPERRYRAAPPRFSITGEKARSDRRDAADRWLWARWPKGYVRKCRNGAHLVP